MSNNIFRLTRLHLKGTLGISEGFSSKDEQKWKKSLGVLMTYVIVGILAVILLSLISNAIAAAGFATHVPTLATVIAICAIFILNIFKSGSTVFDLKLFETEAALPVTSFQIVSSRFLVMYVVNLLLAILIMVPGLVVCGLYLPSFTPLYLIASIIGVLLVPLIPLTVSTAIGAVLYAISARMRHRKAVIIILGLALMVAAMLVYFLFIGNSSSSGTAIPTALADLVIDNFSAITGWCIPASLLTEGMLGGILSLVYFVAISLGFYVGLLLLVSWKYLPICQAMQIKDARHNYVMHEQEAISVKKSLFRRDFKRYLSSTTYVFNTLFGYILMVVLGVAVLFARDIPFLATWDKLGFLSIFCAFGMAMLISISSTTCASISIEGKNWWILQTLPVAAKDIYSSKIKINLAVALPFYVISEVLLIIAMQPSVLEIVALLALPLVYLYLMSVFGMLMSIRHPRFIWDYETEAVKKGVGLILSIVIALGSLVVALILVIASGFIFNGVSVYSWIVVCGVALIIFVVALLVHHKVNKIPIIDIVE